MKNIDIESIDAKLDSLKPSTNITMLSEIQSLPTNRGITLMDESHPFFITMVDSITKQSLNSKCCFWCRHHFDSTPIGCPIKYVPNIAIKTCRSEVTGEIFTVKQTVPVSTIAPEDETRIIQNDYFETEGVFCSFNCCMAFIEDNVHNPVFRHSKSLLARIHARIHKTPIKINPSPSWRLLADYGGHMTIEEFRKSVDRYIYIDTGYRTTNIPKMAPIGHIFEEVYIF